MATDDIVTFIVLCPGRSGSTMLTERLSSHPNVACLGEVLNAETPFAYPVRLPREQRLTSVPGDVDSFVQRTVWDYRQPDLRAVGFKLLDDQCHANYAVLKAHIGQRPAIRPIFLQRRDLLAIYVSRHRAHNVGAAWRFDDDSPIDTSLIRIEASDLARFFKLTSVLHAAMRALFEGRESLDVWYEDLVQTPEQQDARLCNFLGVPMAPLSQRSVKASKGPIHQGISNYAALREAFRGTPWERHFPQEGCDHP